MKSRSNLHVCYIWFVYILAYPHAHILRFLCTCLYPRIIISSCSCVLACILASSHPHIPRFMCACWYPHILGSSDLCVLLVCSHLQVNVFSIPINKRILASLSSLVLGNCASQFVNYKYFRQDRLLFWTFTRRGRKSIRNSHWKLIWKKCCC